MLYVRSECRETDTELGCNDDDGLSVSTLKLDRVEPGTYYIVVDTASSTALGNYRLSVSAFTPEKEACTLGASTCSPGLECRLFTEGGVTAATATCEKPECSDGEDSDGDGLVDFPDEPGCLDLADNDETDDCPAGAGCAACSNEIDDDADGLIDFGTGAGADPGCQSASDDLELDECIPGVTVIDLADSGASGTNTSAVDNFDPGCDSFTSGETIYAYRNVRNLATLSFSTLGSAGDTVLSVRQDDCADAGAEVACADPGAGGESVTISSPTLDAFYFVFVDSDFSSTVDYVLNVPERFLRAMPAYRPTPSTPAPRASRAAVPTPVSRPSATTTSATMPTAWSTFSTRAVPALMTTTRPTTRPQRRNAPMAWTTMATPSSTFPTTRAVAWPPITTRSIAKTPTPSFP